MSEVEERATATNLSGERLTDQGSQDLPISQQNQASQSSVFRVSGQEAQELAGNGPFVKLNAPLGVQGKYKTSFEDIQVNETLTDQ